MNDANTDQPFKTAKESTAAHTSIKRSLSSVGVNANTVIKETCDFKGLHSSIYAYHSW